jgi:hypothetical protein
MLGKLLRYEFKALLRILPALYLAILVLAVAAGLNRSLAEDYVRDPLGRYLEPALGMMFLALFVVNLIVVILRFRDNFLRDEGYLMFTLPVTERELAASKAIAGFCSFLLTTAAGFLALLICEFISDSANLAEQLARVPQHIERYGGGLAVALKTAVALAGVFQQLCLVYASMTVSQMAPRFRGLAGFGVYLAVMIPAMVFVERPLSRALNLLFSSQGYIPYLGAILVLATAFAALCFCCTCWLLKHTLNLE